MFPLILGFGAPPIGTDSIWRQGESFCGYGVPSSEEICFQYSGNGRLKSKLGFR